MTLKGGPTRKEVEASKLRKRSAEITGIEEKLAQHRIKLCEAEKSHHAAVSLFIMNLNGDNKAPLKKTEGGKRAVIKRFTRLSDSLHRARTCTTVCDNPDSLLGMWKIPENVGSVRNPIEKSSTKPGDPTTYRGILLESCLLKLLMIILTARVVEWADLFNVIPDFQQGFLKGH